MDPRDASKVCKACCLLPGVAESTRLPLATLAEALESETVNAGDGPDGPWGWSTRALVALRSDRAEEALEFVLKSEQNSPSPYAHALNLAVSTLAKIELGDTSGALAEFGKGSRSFAALQTNANDMQFHDLLIASILLREAKDSLDKLLPDGLRSFTGKLPQMDAGDHLEHLLQFEVWDEAAPLACRISEKLPTGNWESERALFLKPLIAKEPLFNAMLESSPNASDIWLARARRLALRSEWQAAVDAFIHSAELKLPESETRFEAACAMLISGNEDAYRELVSTFLEQMGEQPEPYDGFMFARTIGLASQKKQLANQAILLAQAAIDDNNQPYKVHALGLTQLRAGDYEQAQRTLESSLNMLWDIGQDQAALALVCSSLQQQAAAQKWLTAAKDFRQRKLDASTGGAVRGLAIDWLGLNALIAEAERTVPAIRK